jgi:hypothetical protein
MDTEQSFKEILLKESDVVCEPSSARELTHQELNEWYANLKKQRNKSSTTNSSEAEEMFWSTFDNVLAGCMKELKEYYFFDGFLDELKYEDVLTVFKKNIVVEKLLNTDDEDNQSNQEEDEINF